MSQKSLTREQKKRLFPRLRAAALAIAQEMGIPAHVNAARISGTGSCGDEHLEEVAVGFVFGTKPGQQSAFVRNGNNES